MWETFITLRRADLPLIITGRRRSQGFDLGKIKCAGAGPDILTQQRGSNLCAFVIEDGQTPAAQTAASRAFDADIEFESLSCRDGRRHSPGIHMRRMSQCREGKRG